MVSVRGQAPFILIYHSVAVFAAKTAPTEMEDAREAVAVWAGNEPPIAGGPSVAGDCFHSSLPHLNRHQQQLKPGVGVMLPNALPIGAVQNERSCR